MKKLLLLFSIVFVFAYFLLRSTPFDINDELSNLLSLDVENENSIQEGVDFVGSYKTLNDKGIYLAIFPNSLNFSIYKQDPNLKDFQLKLSTKDIISHDYLFGMNSSFFTPDYDHIGLLVDNGKTKSQLSVNNPQATHVFELSPSKQIYSTEEFNKLPNSYITSDSTLLQTGPLIIDEGIIQTQYIENSLNGNSEHFRSIVGFTEDRVFFIATRKLYSLVELADLILALPEFAGTNVTAINLDGGSSVSLYSSENPVFKFGEAKKLPYYILVKN